MNVIDFYKLSGVMSASTWKEFKKEINYRYGILTDKQYFALAEQNNLQWTNQNFDYKFNEFGFRDSEIIDQVDTCYYGCSITTGIGVPETARWTDILDSQQGWCSNNFGIPGIGVEECAYLFAQTTKLVKMNHAIFLLPDAYRCTMAYHADKETIFYNNLHANFKERRDSYNPEAYRIAELVYRLPDTYPIDRARNAINLIRYIGQLTNIQVTFSSWSQPVFDLLKYASDIVCIKNDFQGRDSLHPGPDYHKQIANQFTSLL